MKPNDKLGQQAERIWGLERDRNGKVRACLFVGRVAQIQRYRELMTGLATLANVGPGTKEQGKSLRISAQHCTCAL
jgi:hypothetical protein